MFATYKAAVAVILERKTWVPIFVEWAEALVSLYFQPETESHSLDGEGSEFLNVESMHKVSSFMFQVSGFKGFQVSK